MFNFWRKKIQPVTNHLLLPGDFVLEGSALPGEWFGSRLVHTLLVWKTHFEVLQPESPFRLDDVMSYTTWTIQGWRQLPAVRIRMWPPPEGRSAEQWLEAIRWLREALNGMDPLPEDVAEVFENFKARRGQ